MGEVDAELSAQQHLQQHTSYKFLNISKQFLHCTKCFVYLEIVGLPK